jgi:hypothetical protein
VRNDVVSGYNDIFNPANLPFLLRNATPISLA